VGCNLGPAIAIKKYVGRAMPPAIADVEYKEFATKFFESLEYKVTPIPMATALGELRADLMVESGDDVFIVEAKAKTKAV
jgi:hypothetical protein